MARRGNRRDNTFDRALTRAAFIGPHTLNSASAAALIYLYGADDLLVSFLIASVSSAAVWTGVLSLRGGLAAARPIRLVAAILMWPAAVVHFGFVAYELTQYSPGDLVKLPPSVATLLLSTPTSCFFSLTLLAITAHTWLSAGGGDPADGD